MLDNSTQQDLDHVNITQEAWNLYNRTDRNYPAIKWITLVKHLATACSRLLLLLLGWPNTGTNSWKAKSELPNISLVLLVHQLAYQTVLYNSLSHHFNIVGLPQKIATNTQLEDQTRRCKWTASYETSK